MTNISTCPPQCSPPLGYPQGSFCRPCPGPGFPLLSCSDCSRLYISLSPVPIANHRPICPTDFSYEWEALDSAYCDLATICPTQGDPFDPMIEGHSPEESVSCPCHRFSRRHSFRLDHSKLPTKPPKPFRDCDFTEHKFKSVLTGFQGTNTYHLLLLRLPAPQKQTILPSAVTAPLVRGTRQPQELSQDGDQNIRRYCMYKQMGCFCYKNLAS